MCSPPRVHTDRFSVVIVSFVLSLVWALLLPTGALAFDGEFKPLGGVWDVDGGPIRYALDPAGTPDVPGTDELDAVRDAFRAWACVPGTKLRFDESDEPGPRRMDLGDGINTVFWDETGSDCLMGQGTLGITSGDVGGANRNAADICFNGFHHTWGIGRDTDVKSIALHEIGHLIGLDHPCDNDQNSSSCLPPERAVMFPSWSGSPDEEPRQSDIAGVVSLYPQEPGDPSGCEGPFRAGERCSCNDECVDGFCIPDSEGELRCGKTCSSARRDCGAGSTCVLDVPQDGQDAVGSCVRTPGNKPAGAICAAASECESGTCAAVFSLGASICQVPCSSSSDCAGGACHDGLCLGGFEPQKCPAADDDDPDCGCTTTTSSGAPAAGLAVAAALMMLLRRRRRVDIPA